METPEVSWNRTRVPVFLDLTLLWSMREGTSLSILSMVLEQSGPSVIGFHLRCWGRGMVIGGREQGILVAWVSPKQGADACELETNLPRKRNPKK